MNLSKHVLAGFAIGLLIATAPACGPAKQCNPTTCPAGCCDASGTCQQSSQSSCGQLGQTCQTCQLGQVCNLGVCQSNISGGGGNGSTGGGSGTTGGGSGTTGGGSATTGGGSGTTGGGNGTTGGGSGTTGGGAGTTGGGSGTTGGGTGSCDGCIHPVIGCVIYANSNTQSICGQGGAACQECSGSTPVCNQSTRTCVSGGTGGGSGTTGGGTGTTGGGTGSTGGGTGTTNQPVGGACTSSNNCASGLTCKTQTAQGNAQYPGGYCTRSCTDSSVCGAGGLCVVDNSGFTFYGEPNSFCLAGCASAGSQSTCRSGYICSFAETGQPGFCWLNPAPAPVNGNATSTGNACSQDSSCQNPPHPDLGFCFPPTLPDGGVSPFTQGYCSADCSFDLRGDFCGSNGTCIQFTNGTPNDPSDDNNLCLRNCTTPGQISNCRSGYTCLDVGKPAGQGGVCFPP